MKNAWHHVYSQHHCGKINDYYVNVDKQVKIIINAVNYKLNTSKSEAGKAIAKLDTLSPLKTLTRGYCLTQINGRIVKSVKDIKKDDTIDLTFSDGTKQAQII